MKIITKIIDFLKYILYICRVCSKKRYMIDLKNVLLSDASFRIYRINRSTLVHTLLMNTRLSPSTTNGGGFFYKLYSGCISLHLTKALQNNTASINSTRMISKLGTVCPLDNRVSSYAYKLGYFKNLYTFIADI